MSITPLTDRNMALVEGDTVLAPNRSDAWMSALLQRAEKWDLTVDFSDGGTLYMTTASPVDGTLFRITCPDDAEAGLLWMAMDGFEQWVGLPIVAFAGGRVTGKGEYVVTFYVEPR